MSNVEDLLYGLGAYAILAAVGGVAYVLVRRFVPGGASRLFPMPRLPRGDWTGREVLLTFFILLLIPTFCVSVLEGLGFFDRVYDTPPSTDQKLLWSSLLAVPMILALIFGNLYAASGTRPADLGVSLVRLAANLRLGYFGFLTLSPLVWLINFLIIQLIEPREHAFQRVLKDAMPVEWALVIFEATIGAPIYEELVFRGVLQGWLSRANRHGHFAVAIACILAAHLGWLSYLADEKGETPCPGWEPTAFVLILAGAYVAATIRSGLSNSAPEEKQPDTEGKVNSTTSHPYLGIWGTSLLFATVHGAWPSPIPLFVLSLGLGWLAYRSQSLIGPMVVHSLFNGITCLALLLKAM